MNRYICKILVIFGVWIITPDFVLGAEISHNNLITYASPEMIKICDSLVALHPVRAGAHDSAWNSHYALEVKFSDHFSIMDTTYLGFIIGCGANGEFILIDTIKPDLIRARIKLQIPENNAIFNKLELKDINGDNIPELRFNLAGGAHGYYSCFLTLDLDSLRFITDDKGQNLFFAIRGGIKLLPTNNPNIYDIEVGKWPDSGQSSKSTIYKWNGNNYEADVSFPVK